MARKQVSINGKGLSIEAIIENPNSAHEPLFKVMSGYHPTKEKKSAKSDQHTTVLTIENLSEGCIVDVNGKRFDRPGVVKIIFGGDTKRQSVISGLKATGASLEAISSDNLELMKYPFAILSPEEAETRLKCK
jgi:hypothetical protein